MAIPRRFRTRVITDGVITSLQSTIRATASYVPQGGSRTPQRGDNQQKPRFLYRQELTQLPGRFGKSASSQPWSPGNGKQHTRLYGRRTDPRHSIFPARPASTSVGSASVIPWVQASGTCWFSICYPRASPIATYPATGCLIGSMCRPIHPRPPESSFATAPSPRFDRTHSQDAPLQSHRFWFPCRGLCTRTHARIRRRSLGLVLPATSLFSSVLRRSFDKLEQEMNTCVDQAKLAA
jgi:hypothetical protein